MKEIGKLREIFFAPPSLLALQQRTPQKGHLYSVLESRLKERRLNACSFSTLSLPARWMSLLSGGVSDRSLCFVSMASNIASPSIASSHNMSEHEYLHSCLVESQAAVACPCTPPSPSKSHAVSSLPHAGEAVPASQKTVSSPHWSLEDPRCIDMLTLFEEQHELLGPGSSTVWGIGGPGSHEGDPTQPFQVIG